MISKSVLGVLIQCALLTEIRGLSFITKDNYNTSLQVTTKNGAVQGKQVYSEDGTTYFGYYGIPFAAPPIKSLRFRDPKPMRRWKGVLDATNFQSGCVETQFRLTGDVLITFGSEDCLYLNVYTPVRKKSAESVPTLFYIYGGAFVEGSSHGYPPDYLIQQDLIVVTFDFRSGLLGFFSTEDEAAYGNYGLKDQYAAMKWVNRNIKQFGGDPNQVTMVGHSSGSISAMYQMIYPKSWGFYNRVMCLSGEVTASLGLQRNPRRTAFDVGLSLGIETDNSTELVQRLRRMTEDQLKLAQRKVILSGSPSMLESGLLFTPVIEKEHQDAFITQPAIDLLKSGKFARVPLFIGTTTNEAASVFGIMNFVRVVVLLYEWSPGTFPSQLDIQSVTKRRLVGKEIRKKYFKSGSFVDATDNELSQVLSDVLYTRPIITSVKIMSKHVPVYFYVFNYTSFITKKYLFDGGYPVDITLNGVGHIEDLSYIWKFKNLELPPEGKKLSKKMTKLWSNFARYGNPTPTPDPLLQNLTWPQLLPNSKTIPYLRIEGNLSISENYRMEFVDFLNNLNDDRE